MVAGIKNKIVPKILIKDNLSPFRLRKQEPQFNPIPMARKTAGVGLELKLLGSNYFTLPDLLK